ncbi:hypothetical protein DXG01_001576 [Tephrocybe rancida]|nr:hypothetical protein DXG01_001576 [Tephrocybe rancida]
MPTHRKRTSALRLSSDTTHSLPLYVASNNDDRPPDYPDSAEEGDADTDSSDSSVFLSPPLISPLPSASFSPRRRRFTPTHRRRQSTTSPTDPYLDSLLARSVHALEMSNTLLQSTMSTQTTLSTIFADSPADEVLESSARGLSMRIQGRDAHPKWADDLEEITRGVDGLFADESSAEPAQGLSCSLPTASSPMKQQAMGHRRRPSLLELGGTPHLHLSQQDRANLVSPPPRAMTQYVASSADPNTIYLPSTLGARAAASSSSLNLSLHAPLSSPQIIDRPLEPATPAYNMLSSFVNYRPPSSASLTSTPSAHSSPLPRRRSSASSASRPSPAKAKSKSRSPIQTHDSTPKQILTSLPHRPMTPTTEESSSSDGCLAKRTVISLRKILDEQPAPQPPKRPRAPAFLPRTPVPVAEAGTSTATASISRLYTKGKHTASTRAASPPRQSAMKRPSTPSSPTTSTPTSKGPSPSSTVLSIPDLLRVPSWSGSLGRRSAPSSNGSAPSSGPSTPKRISFAELPESYAGSRGGSSARFRDRDKRKKKGPRRDGKKGEEEEERTGWWWLLAGAAAAGSGKGEERVEERLNRGWGGRMPGVSAGFGPGMDEWAI